VYLGHRVLETKLGELSLGTRSRCAAIIAAAILSLVSPSVHAALKGENLLAPIPQGFKAGYTTANSKENTAEFVPTAESVSNWSRMITISVFKVSMLEPDLFAGKLVQEWSAACTGASGQKIKSGLENGYQYSLWLFGCPFNSLTGKPQTMLLKAIMGSYSLYSVQFAYSAKDTDALDNEGLGFLNGVRVCDTRIKARPCPKDIRPPKGAADINKQIQQLK